jgi:hypothetical protein
MWAALSAAIPKIEASMLRHYVISRQRTEATTIFVETFSKTAAAKI